MWRIDTDKAQFALRGWANSDLPRAEAASKLVTHISRQASLRVPVPLATGGRFASLLYPAGGWHWELAPWLEGEADFAAHPSCERLEAMCRALAELHLTAADLPAPEQPLAIRRHFEALADLQQAGQHGHFSRLDSRELPVKCPVGPDWGAALLRGVEVARQQLAPLQAVPLAGQWTWGDAWHNNFLLVGEQVTGVVDFATARIDTPMADLARLLGSTIVEHRDWWAGGIRAYAALRPLSEVESRAVGALCASGTVLSLANWLRWLGIERRVFAAPRAACDRMSHFALRLTHLLGEANTT